MSIEEHDGKEKPWKTGLTCTPAWGYSHLRNAGTVNNSKQLTHTYMNEKNETAEAISQVFAFNDSPVRVVGTQQRPLFVAADVCRVLGLDDVSKAVSPLPEEEKGRNPILTPGGMQEVLVVTEPGLYQLIFRSDKPAAASFRSWVFKEVLPSIRRTGQYNAGEWLRTAFSQAKTGRVQMALLEMMGTHPTASHFTVKVPPGVNPIDAAKFWEALLASFMDGKVKLEWFRCRALSTSEMPLPDRFELFLWPEPILGVLQLLNPVWHNAQRADFRTGLAMAEDWMAGIWKKPFGPAGEVSAQHCWGFVVSPASCVALRQLCAALSDEASKPTVQN